VLVIFGVLTRGIKADVEVGLRMLLVQPLQALPKILIALLVLQDGQRLGLRLAIGAPE
jgi:hypothetical protein